MSTSIKPRSSVQRSLRVSESHPLLVRASWCDSILAPLGYQFWRMPVFLVDMPVQAVDEIIRPARSRLCPVAEEVKNLVFGEFPGQSPLAFVQCAGTAAIPLAALYWARPIGDATRP